MLSSNLEFLGIQVMHVAAFTNGQSGDAHGGGPDETLGAAHASQVELGVSKSGLTLGPDPG